MMLREIGRRLGEVCRLTGTALRQFCARPGSTRGALNARKKRRTSGLESLELRTLFSAGWDLTLIDSAVANQAVLRRAMVPGGRVILYNGQTDSAADVLTRVTDWAQETGSTIKSISMLSEGAPGRFEMGNQWVSNSNLLQTAPEWERLSHVLAKDAVIKLYGCDLADPLGTGQRLIDRVAGVTGAQVFATTNLIGRGGDWAYDAATKQLDALKSSSLVSFPALGFKHQSDTAFDVERSSPQHGSLALAPAEAKGTNQIRNPADAELQTRAAHYAVPQPAVIQPPAAGTLAGWSNRVMATENVVLLDNQLPDSAALAQAVLPGTNLITYDGATQSANSVLSQVINWAKTNDVRISSLSLLSHGHAGAFELGDQWISNTVLAQTAMEWRRLGDVMAPGAAINLFACDVASPGGDGQLLIDRIADLTGEGVFASSNLTGNGGDWNLEAASTGHDPETEPVATAGMNERKLSAYDGTLSAYTVTSTSDSGAGSLRTAITNANSSGGGTINFDIAASGVQTISLSSALPSLTQPVTIDGTTEPGYSGTPLIDLSGTSAGNGSSGLTLDSGASGSTVQGLIINGFSQNAIAIDGSSNVTIQGNYIGINAAGSAAAGNGNYGIYIYGGSSNDTIGGTTAAARNIISGSSKYGIYVNGNSTSDNTIEGNYIGTDSTGQHSISNGGWGIVVQSGATGTVIGGTAPGAGNVISGNTSPSAINASGGIGLALTSNSNTTVEGNIIGLNATQTAALPNGFSGEAFGAGVYVEDTNTGVTIGGTSAGAGNVIADNTGPGVATDNAADQAEILGNSIYGNSGLGIDLKQDGVTANSSSETSNAPNKLMDYPVFTAATISGSSLTVSGYVGSAASQSAFANARVEVFTSDNDSSGYGQGQTYLGYLTTDSSGNFSGTLTGVSGITAGSSEITGTATDTGGNTSEFGANLVATTLSYVVTNTNDSGAGSLRQAILYSNASSGGNTITFNIPGSGVHTITPASALPVLTQSVTIDGTSQPGYSGTPLIQIVGSSAGAGTNAIEVDAGNCAIEGLAIDNFSGNGVQIDGVNNTIIQANYLGIDPTGTTAEKDGDGIAVNAASGTIIGGTSAAIRNVISGNYNQGVYISGGSNNVVEGNYIGTNAAGTASVGNGQNATSQGIVIRSGSTNNTIGGAAPGAGNVISGNNNVGVEITGSGTSGNVVEGNNIGTNASGSAALANSTYGVEIDTSATGNTVGGSTSGAANIISGNSNAGVYLAAASNSVAGNTIGLNAAGTTALGNSYGIYIENVADNTIGGTTSAARNIISGNYDGIDISGSSATGNVVEGDYIGTNAAGTAAVGNVYKGVYIIGGATGNIIGGTAMGAGNLISGNSSKGVEIDAGSNTVQGNVVGLNAAGTANLPNDYGIYISNDAGNTIGGMIAAARNVISGNSSAGVYIGGASATGNAVEGNYVGTDASGSVAIANGLDGVLITNSASGNTIGGTGGAGNIISGNDANGIEIDSDVSSTTVEGNSIGLNSTGTSAIANTDEGIDVQGSSNIIGGSSSVAQNVISGNGGNGVLIETASATGNLVQGNRIGTNTAGAAAVGNAYSGVFIEGGSANTIQSNLLSGNAQAGVTVYSSSTTGNSIVGNDIGVNAGATAGIANNVGVNVNGSSGNTIGGTVAGAANVIADNTDQGVVVSGTGVSADAVSENSIYANGALGIDLGGDGVTANTGANNSSLPNDGINFPVITATSLSGSTLSVSGYVGSAPNQSAFAGARVEIFQTDQNASGYGQGQTYLGYLTANSSGNFTGTLSVSGLTSANYLTATATDSSGDTSEFGPNLNDAQPLTVVTPASASASTVTGTTVNLSVLGSDAGGESNITYTWATIGGSPTGVTYSANGNNAAKSTTATFTAAGTYNFQVTLTDPQGHSVNSDVTVTINQTLTSISIPNAPPAIADNETYPYTATALDQFGNAMTTQPAFTWSVQSGGAGGTISNSGLYSTPESSTGTDNIQVTGGGKSATAAVTVTGDGILSGGIDVGPPALPGYFSYSNGTYTVTGGDNGNSSNSSQFQFADSAVTGDAALIAQIDTLSSGGTASYGGVTFRDGTGSGAITAAVGLESNGAVLFQYRSATGTASSIAFASASFPQWVKLLRVGNTFSAFFSSNGTNWTQVGQSQTFTAPTTLLGGLAVTSDDPTVLSTATFSNVSLSQATVATAAAATPNPVTGTTTSLSVLGADPQGESNLTYSWATIGTPPAAVSFSDNNDNSAKNTTATFTAAGTYDFQVTITDPQGNSATSDVTVTVDQTLTSISIPAAPSAIADNETYPFAAVALDQFGTAMASQPAFTWSVASGSAGGTISNAGLYQTPASGTGTDTIQVTGGGISRSASVSVTGDGIFSGGEDIGPPALPGYFSYSNGTYTVTGGDHNNSNTEDQFQFPNSTFNGDAVLVAKVAAMNGTSTAGLAGVILRSTSDNDSPFVGVFLIGGEVSFQVRNAVGVADTSSNVSGINAPEWVKIVRSGNSYSGYYSTDGVTWTQVGSTVTYSAPNSILGGLIVTSVNPAALSTTTFTNVSQLSVATPAAVSPSPVAGMTANVSVLGAYSGGESNLSYTWSTTGTPPAPVTFLNNGDNTAKNTTATFAKAGIYNLLVTISDGTDTVTSPVTVAVDQTDTNIVVSPATNSLNENGTDQFTAVAYDQFGNVLQTQPSFNWSVSSGIGTVTSNGLYTAPAASGSGTVTAADGSTAASASVTIINAAPTIATAAAASPSPVTGTTTNLTVVGADDGGESNLTYTWAATAEPSGSNPQFSINGTNSSKDTTATFNEAGDYTFTCTITDSGGLTTTSSVDVTVNRTLTSITVAPATVSLSKNQQQQFAATAFDQFGASMATQPGFTWAVTGVGSIDASSGVYTAPDGTGSATITASNGSVSGDARATVTNAAPTIAIAASATPNTVTSTTTSLSVLGADDGGESNLTYTWAATAEPNGSDPQFSINGTNASKNTSVSFDQAGSYTFTCTVTDSGGLTTTSSVIVTVNQTLSSIQIAPASPTANLHGTDQFAATGFDQFGNAMATQPTVNWAVASGGGSINSSGLYTAPGTPGSATVSATSGAVVGHASVTITNAAPTVAAPASTSSNPVTGSTTHLSALGADDSGEASLTYTWTATSEPSGSDPRFSVNGTNASKNTTATFDEAGDYTFTCTMTDPFGATVASSVNVTVNQTLTEIAVLPGDPTVNQNQQQQFTATGYDQFNNIMSSQPTLAWSCAGFGAIDPSGLYIAPDSVGSTQITASSGAVVGATNINITNAPPTVATAAAASPSPVTGTTTNLSVLGADDGGESNLTYTWAATARPNGSDPIFNSNNTNASKDSTVTFDRSGDYTFTCAITDSGGLTTTSSVSVTVDQALTTISVSPGSTSLNEYQQQQFTATGFDQFGDVLLTQPAFNWSQASGGGSIDSSGLYSAPGVPTSAGLNATSGSVSGSATAVVTDAPPTVAILAAATPSTVTGTSTALSVLGADDGGERNLTYTWIATTIPAGADDPTYLINGNNAAKETTANFTQAGDYTFTVTITDAENLSTTSSVSIDVDQTLTTVQLNPPTSGLNENGTQQFTATAFDQFDRVMAQQPSFNWSIAGVGSIDTAGRYFAPGSPGAATVTATVGSISASASVTVTNAVPTVATPAAASSNIVTTASTSLSVLGADDGGEANLIYTWTSVGASPATVKFTDNGTNAAKNTTAIFSQPGDYELQATITDAGGLSVTSDVNVNVVSTLTSIAVTPATVKLDENGVEQFSAVANDQFGNPLATQPAIEWVVSNGPGSIGVNGLFSATETTGAVTIAANSGGVAGTAYVVVKNAPPTVVIPAHGTASPIVARNAHLSVLGADDGGEDNLTYSWSTTGNPPGDVSFLLDGTNAAKNTVATFSEAGTYQLQVTITDAGGLSTDSAVTVHVDQTLTTIAVSPGHAVINRAAPLRLYAVGYDQFGAVMVSQPDVDWTVEGVGTVDGTGVYESPASTGSAIVTAADGNIRGSAIIAVVDTASIVLNPPTLPPLIPQPSLLPAYSVLPPPSPNGDNQGAPEPPAPTPVLPSPILGAPSANPVVNPTPAPAPAPTPTPAPKLNEQAAVAAPVPPVAVARATVPRVVARERVTTEVHQEDMRMLQKQLSLLNEKLTSSSQTERGVRAVVGSASAVAGTAVVGYVIWILRSSSLLASALAGLPMWRFLDPLPVLDRWRKRKLDDADAEKDDETDQATRKLESMFR